MRQCKRFEYLVYILIGSVSYTHLDVYKRQHLSYFFFHSHKLQYRIYLMSIILLHCLGGIGVCAYLLPALGYFNRRYYVAEKMKRFTKEIDATIIKVIKSLDDGEFPHSTIYIPIGILAGL